MTAFAIDIDEALARIDALPPHKQREALALLAAEGGVIVPHTAYQQDPIGWAVDKMAIPEHTIRWSLNPGYETHAWDGDVDPLVLVAEALANWENVGVESCTSSGKTFWAAVLICWFLACFQDARVFTFAPKEEQLRAYIWMEIGRLWPRFSAHFPTATLTDLKIRMRGGADADDKNQVWGATGVAVGIRAGEDVSTKASGMHAEHMLLIYEEMQGHDQSVIEAGENACTAPHNLRLAIGNPNSQLDALHKFCVLPYVTQVRVSAYDHPNVVSGNPNLIPGAVSAASISRRLQKYGIDSPVFQSRIKGISPEQAADSLIRLEWLKASAVRWKARQSISPQYAKSGHSIQEVSENAALDTASSAYSQFERRSANAPSQPIANPTGPKPVMPIGALVTGKGVDVANSEHGDRACICDFSGNAVIRLDAFACPDSNALGRKVKLECDAAGLDANRVGVDATGVGAGTVNELRRLQCIVQALHFGAKPMAMVEKLPDGKRYEWTGDVNIFPNLRSQMYWQLREDLRLNRIDMDEDGELREELTCPTFVDEPKTIIEPKDEIKARLGRSPDKADALALANFVRARAFVAPVVEQQQGRSLGWDPKTQRPVERETGQAYFDRMLKKAQGDPRSGRMRVPRKPR